MKDLSSVLQLFLPARIAQKNTSARALHFDLYHFCPNGQVPDMPHPVTLILIYAK
jgi:hypothetical protein